jgi:hypothetical protein
MVCDVIGTLENLLKGVNKRRNMELDINVNFSWICLGYGTVLLFNKYSFASNVTFL